MNVNICNFSFAFCKLFIQMIKGTRSNCFRLFSNFLRFLYQKKAHIFLITPEFYSWEIYHFDKYYENVTSYDNHNKALYTVTYRQFQNMLSHLVSKRFDGFNWNLKPRFLGWWRIIWINISILRHRTMHLLLHGIFYSFAWLFCVL